MQTVSATELARNLRAVLDAVEFRGEEISVVRNQHPIARILPGAPRMTALQAMADLYRTLPEDAGATWLDDARQANTSTLDEENDPWAS